MKRRAFHSVTIRRWDHVCSGQLYLSVLAETGFSNLAAYCLMNIDNSFLRHDRMKRYTFHSVTIRRWVVISLQKKTAGGQYSTK